MPESTVDRLMREKKEVTPEIGDTWTPSMPFPLTARDKHEKREQEKEKNRLKNANRRKAKKEKIFIPKARLEAGKQLRQAFGGAFGHAPKNVKFMAAQGTTKQGPENPRGEKSEE